MCREEGPSLAEAEHDAGLGVQLVVRRLGMLQHRQRLSKGEKV